jgi:hypothetical protein
MKISRSRCHRLPPVYMMLSSEYGVETQLIISCFLRSTEQQAPLFLFAPARQLNICIYSKTVLLFRRCRE